jgi:hypothetical protein
MNWTQMIGWLVAVLVAIIPNLDKIMETHEKYLKKSGAIWDSPWTGVHQYPTFEQGTGRITAMPIQRESISIHGTQEKVSGEIINNTLSSPRFWNVTGTFKNDVLILPYIEKRDANKSLGAVVVEPIDTGKKTFMGFWLGIHEDANRLVACPYIMTTENPATIEQQHAQFLNKPCIVK